jgi:hypothetical protein
MRSPIVEILRSLQWLSRSTASVITSIYHPPFAYFVLKHFRPLTGKETTQGSPSGWRSADSGSLRLRAEECRTLAETFNDVETREIMLRFAADYEILADRLEPAANDERPHIQSA